MKTENEGTRLFLLKWDDEADRAENSDKALGDKREMKL